MAQKRMFDKTIIETDNFMDLPISSKALYFLLGMEADDEGFVSPNRVLRLYGGSEDDIKVLITKGFIIKFNSGVIVVTDWKKNNWLDTRRIKETQYIEEKSQLIEEHNRYVLNSAKPSLSTCSVSIEENSIDKYSIDNIPSIEDKPQVDLKHKYGEYKKVLLKDDELEKLKKDYSNWQELITYLDEYIEMKGYKAKNHYLCIKKWVVDAVKKNQPTTNTEEEKLKKMLSFLEE